MKISFLLLLILTYAVSVTAQQTTGEIPVVKTDYLKKSRKQQTAAWLLLGGGFAFTATGILVASNELSNNLVNIFNPEEQKSSTASTVLLVTGAAAMVGSIPLFIASSNNKKRGENISVFLKKESGPVLQHLSFINLSYPAIAIKLDF